MIGSTFSFVNKPSSSSSSRGGKLSYPKVHLQRMKEFLKSKIGGMGGGGDCAKVAHGQSAKTKII